MLVIKSVVKLVSATLFLSTASAWGGIAHRAIGYLAFEYMSPAAREFFDRYVQPDEDFDIGDAAVWADGQKRNTWAKYTDTWHYIDAKDDPPNKCGVNYKRDCSVSAQAGHSGCVVSAILNMTSRITNHSLQPIDIANSTKFLLHFISDLTQPLHTEDKARGGNDIKVDFDGRDSNLHKVWDGQIVEKAIKFKGGNEKKAAAAWAKKLHEENQAVLKLDPADECVPSGSPNTALDCVMSWADKSNAYICLYVLNSEIFPGVEQEVGGKYADNAFPIVKLQVTKAALRFANVLNQLAWSEDTDDAGLHVLAEEL